MSRWYRYSVEVEASSEPGSPERRWQSQARISALQPRGDDFGEIFGREYGATPAEAELKMVKRVAAWLAEPGD